MESYAPQERYLDVLFDNFLKRFLTLAFLNVGIVFLQKFECWEKTVILQKQVIAMSKQEQDKSYFIAFCIEQYKVFKGMDGAEAARLFFEKGISSYLADNYEVLHTQSHQWLMEEIDGLLNKK